MLYPKLKFPKVSGRPFFYTNFVQTVDGKVQVKKPGYWPIGSKTDHDVLMELRGHTDVLIHGANLAKEFGKITLKHLPKKVAYYVMSRESLGAKLDHLEGGLRWHLFSGSIKKLVNELQSKGYRNILVEGGPTLLGSFLKENLIDEIFLTIAPKIYGTESGSTLTLVEGILFNPANIKKLKLVSVKKVGDELFLRYRAQNQ